MTSQTFVSQLSYDEFDILANVYHACFSILDLFNCIFFAFAVDIIRNSHRGNECGFVSYLVI